VQPEHNHIIGQPLPFLKAGSYPFGLLELAKRATLVEKSWTRNEVGVPDTVVEPQHLPRPRCDDSRRNNNDPSLPIMLALIFLFLILGISVSSCTIVQVAGAEPETTHGFGIVNLHLNGFKGQPVTVSTTGLGLTFGGGSTTLGWLREVIITAPDAAKCRVFIVVEKKDDLQALADLLTRDTRLLENICLSSKEAEKWPE